MTQDNLTTGTTTVGVATTDISIGERIRWGPIVAGLFSALSTLIVLTILGAAIGLSAWDRGDTGEGWTIGAADRPRWRRGRSRKAGDGRAPQRWACPSVETFQKGIASSTPPRAVASAGGLAFAWGFGSALASAAASVF